MVETKAKDGGLPDTEERLRQAEAARHAITAMGMVEIGMDHYALPDDPMAIAWRQGNRQRNFQGFTTDDAETLIGFGASAISSLPDGYAQNQPHIAHYRTAVMNGEQPIARGIALTDEDRLRRQVISDIMCEKVVHLPTICADFGQPEDHFEGLSAKLDHLAEDGLILHADGHLALTQAGRRFSRSVAAVFDAYLGNTEGTPKHSQAS